MNNATMQEKGHSRHCYLISPRSVIMWGMLRDLFDIYELPADSSLFESPGRANLPYLSQDMPVSRLGCCSRLGPLSMIRSVLTSARFLGKSLAAQDLEPIVSYLPFRCLFRIRGRRVLNGWPWGCVVSSIDSEVDMYWRHVTVAAITAPLGERLLEYIGHYLDLDK
jgi:hypothetical protein